MTKTVLVTGSAKGIGRAICKEFSNLNYNVVINYLTSEKEALSLKEELDKTSCKSLAIKCDVSNEEEVNQMFNKIEETFGGVDIIVNNAGVDISDFFSKQKVEDFKRTLDTNVISSYIVSKRGYKYMENKKWGRIINISSTNGMNTYYPISIFYDVSKSALNQLTHDLSLQFSPYITVNAVAPGFIGTESELEGYTEEFLKSEVEKIFVKRYGTPEDVAHLVRFLSSDDANFINNQIIRIDGGQYGD